MIDGRRTWIRMAAMLQQFALEISMWDIRGNARKQLLSTTLNKYSHTIWRLQQRRLLLLSLNLKCFVFAGRFISFICFLFNFLCKHFAFWIWKRGRGRFHRLSIFCSASQSRQIQNENVESPAREILREIIHNSCSSFVHSIRFLPRFFVVAVCIVLFDSNYSNTVNSLLCICFIWFYLFSFVFFSIARLAETRRICLCAHDSLASEVEAQMVVIH